MFSSGRAFRNSNDKTAEIKKVYFFVILSTKTKDGRVIYSKEKLVRGM